VQNTRTFWLVNKDKLPTYLFSLSGKATISDFGTRSHTAKLIATSCVCHNRLQCLLPLLLPHLGRLHSRRPAQYVLLLALLLLVL
jgi:hypothetical protein